MTTELVPVPSLTGDITAFQAVDLMDAFLAGRKATTLRAYDRDLKDFAKSTGHDTSRKAVEWLLGQTHGQANAIALAYRSKLTGRGLKSATIARRLAALRSIVTLARTLGRIHWALDVESPKVVPYRDTKGPGDSGWYLMLAHASAAAEHERGRSYPTKGRRDLALLRVLHDLALRRNEVASLDRESVDLEAKTVAVVGKGQTDAITLTLPDPTAAALAQWIAVRGDAPGPLFHRLDTAAEGDTRITGDGVYYLVRQLAKRAGVKRPVWPHALRHQAITSALDRTGGNVRTVQRYSRHADPRTLLRYDDARTDAAGQVARLVAGD